MCTVLKMRITEVEHTPSARVGLLIQVGVFREKSFVSFCSFISEARDGFWLLQERKVRKRMNGYHRKRVLVRHVTRQASTRVCTRDI